MFSFRGFTALTACVCAVAWGVLAHAQDNSTISAGDVLYIEVYRVPELTNSYLVLQNGIISLPYVGNVQVAGLSETAATANVTRALEKILRRPRVTLTNTDIGLIMRGPGRSAAMQLEIIPLQNANAESLSTVLQGMSSPGGHISFDPDTNSLLLTDTPSAIKNMINVITQLDQMQSQLTQVRIETKVAEVRVGALKELGIRWFVQDDKFMGGFNPSPRRTNDLSSLAGNIGSLANELLRPNSSGSSGSGREFLGDGFDRRLNIPVLVPLPGQAFLGFSNAGLDIGAIIDALVSNQDAKLLANPTILTVNHKTAVIKMIDEFPFLEFGTEITGAQRFSVSFLELGIILEVTPHVYQDDTGAYVKMELKPEVSFPIGIANGVPIRSVRSSETVASVRDGQTLVVGGILTEDEKKVVTKLPGLGNLPFIGNLFKHKEETKVRTELMIFVTPTIHRRPEEITWDKMIDVAKELHQTSLFPEIHTRKEVRKN